MEQEKVPNPKVEFTEDLGYRMKLAEKAEEKPESKEELEKKEKNVEQAEDKDAGSGD